MEKLLLLLNAIAPMSPALQDYLRSILRSRVFAKKDWILKEGQVCKNIYFIEKGLVQIFHLREEKRSGTMQDVTTWLLSEGDIFISVLSFFEQSPSFQHIVALEDCLVWYIEYEELIKICKMYSEFWQHRSRIAEAYYSRCISSRMVLYLFSEGDSIKHLLHGPVQTFADPVSLKMAHLGLTMLDAFDL